MSKPYRSNVYVENAGDATFDPPLDAIFVLVAASTPGETPLTIYVDGVDSKIAHGQLSRKTLLRVGGITRIYATGNNLRYIGLREKVNQPINDSLPEGGGGD
tara:strand:- start:6384 stop:6689 length:306 start_codon:yes stop_codon:yes gene_type:complete